MMGSGTLALSPICHHDFGFHDAQKENYERRRDGVLVEKDRVLVMRWWRRSVRIFPCLFFLTSTSTRFLLLVMGK
jgi:hypothetical protein